MDQAAPLQDFLRTQIPLAQAMQLAVDHFDGSTLQVSAPLAPNVNDKGTAFGGSLSAIATLCGWSLLRLRTGGLDNGLMLVIGRCQTRFLRPISSQIVARADVDEEAFVRFAAGVNKGEQIGVTVNVTVADDRQRPAMTMTARYTALAAQS